MVPGVSVGFSSNVSIPTGYSAVSLLGGGARNWGRSLDCGPWWFKSCVALAWDREPVGCRLEYGKDTQFADRKTISKPVFRARG